MQQPLVLTLAIDACAQARFDAERRELFPPGRTQVGAHVTLFHAVPGDLQERVLDDVRATAGPPFVLGVSEVMSLGRGAAYRLESAELSRRHALLQRRWWDALTRQDQQGFRAHVTVANKLPPDAAAETVRMLRARFTPFTVHAHGVVIWRYDGGPWTELARIPFPASTS